MRQIIIAAVLLLFTSARGQGKPPSTLDSEVYTVNQFAILHSQPVAFSVGYPKGWRKQDFDGLPARDSLVRDSPIVCILSSPSSHLGSPEGITIFRATGASAKDEAGGMAAMLHQRFSGAYTNITLSEIKTKAGDSGYLVASEAHFGEEKLMHSDFFFHVGPKGAVRILLRTRSEDVALRANLQNLILETLHF
jgi:hypothetical protein